MDVTIVQDVCPTEAADTRPLKAKKDKKRKKGANKACVKRSEHWGVDEGWLNCDEIKAEVGL